MDTFFLLWPCPFSDDLHVRKWLKYPEDVPAYQKNEVSRSRLSKLRARTGQTDRHEWKYYRAKSADGNKEMQAKNNNHIVYSQAVQFMVV